MENITADDILRLVNRLNTPAAEGDVAAALEFRGPHGYITYLLWAQLSPRVTALEEVAALSGIDSFKLREEEDGTWRAVLRGADMDAAGCTLGLAQQELDTILERFALTLPGRVQSEDAPVEDSEAGGRQAAALPPEDQPPF